MQMYRGLPVITNKLTVEEQRGIPHHLLGSIELDEEPWTVAHFKRDATRIIDEIRARGKLPIVVGGTSYYLDSLLFEGKLVEDNDDPEGKLWSRDLAARYPILTAPTEEVLAKLREVDPVMAAKWHPNDDRKIRHSLEIYYATGRRASEIYEEQRNRKLQAKSGTNGSNGAPELEIGEVLLFWLYAHQEELKERLAQRVDKMVERGLLDEVSEMYDYLQSRLSAGETVDRTKGIWQSIGFRQFEPYLSTLRQNPSDPNLEKLKQAGIEETKIATRQYAKTQVRWVTMKTITSLQEENLLDRFYLLDSTDISRWHDEVLNKGVDLAAKFLACKPLPKPEEVSDTARQVLAEKVARAGKKDTPCHRVCELCNKTLVTEELWQKHIKGRKHTNAVRSAKRRALIPAHLAPTRAVVVAENGNKDDESKEEKESAAPDAASESETAIPAVTTAESPA